MPYAYKNLLLGWILTNQNVYSFFFAISSLEFLYKKAAAITELLKIVLITKFNNNVKSADSIIIVNTLAVKKKVVYSHKTNLVLTDTY